MEETEQVKKQKKEKNSSENMIDSFFGSHNLDEVSTNQEDKEKFQETEQKIDQIIGNSLSTDEQPKSMKPTVEIVDNQTKHLQNNKNEKPRDEEYKDENQWNPVIQHHENEEIFEIDHPKTPYHSEQQKDEPIETIKKTKSSSKPKQKNKSPKKNSFSFHLPKLNFKFGKNKKKQEKQPNEPLPVFKEKKEEPNQLSSSSFDNNTKDSNGRIHGLTEIKETTEQPPTIKENIPKENPEGLEVNKKKSLLNKSKTSFNFFKKRTNEKATEQKSPQISKKESPEKTIRSTEQDSPSETVDEDVIQLLKITDDLLGKLPDEVIEEFSQSEDFALYEKVMKKYDIVK